jgi:hypothetical protein
MAKHYVTLGYDHVHLIDGKILDRDTVAVFEAESAQKGREKAFELFGAKFCFEYHDTKWKESNMQYFPKGYVYINI